MSCPGVEISHIEFYHFEAEGCGESRLYHCPSRDTCESSGGQTNVAEDGESTNETPDDEAGNDAVEENAHENGDDLDPAS